MPLVEECGKPQCTKGLGRHHVRARRFLSKFERTRTQGEGGVRIRALREISFEETGAAIKGGSVVVEE